MCDRVSELYEGVWSAPACMHYICYNMTDILLLWHEAQMLSVSSDFEHVSWFGISKCLYMIKAYTRVLRFSRLFFLIIFP